MTQASPLLDVRGVFVKFGGLQALGDVSLQVETGEILALIGPNGAGKTTLLNVLAGARVPTAGSVYFKGEQIDGEGAHAVNRRGIARTFQSVELLNRLSVRENVMAGGVSSSNLGIIPSMIGFGRSQKVARQLAEDAARHLEFVGLGDRADDPSSILPAGQQRLLGIARALATGAEFLILDEPAAGLNDSEKTELVGVIQKLKDAGKTVLFVEHDMSVVGRLAERIIVLDNGVIIAEDVPHKVRRDPKVIEAYLGKPGEAKTPAARKKSKSSKQDRAPLLVVGNLSVNYGGLTALSNISIDVKQDEIVAVIGANGAGKSTLLKSIAGIVPSSNGSINLDGEDIDRISAEKIVARGISLAPEGRELFPSLNVYDNLTLGQYAFTGKMGLRNLLWQSPELIKARKERLDEVYDLFPVLKERRDQLAGTLSGGQGQMLAIGRALMGAPKLLMLDEPSLGLAPQVVAEIMQCLTRLRAAGLTILLIEQNARAALEIADRAYVLTTGKVTSSGTGQKLLAAEDISSSYLGWDEKAGSARKSRPKQLQKAGRGR